MLLFSQQYRIIKNIALSYKNNKKTFTKITDSELKNHKNYRYNRFETWTESDFKLLIIYIFYKGYVSTIRDCIQFLNNTDYKTLRSYLSIRDDIISYKNTLRKDISIIKGYEQKIQVIVAMEKVDKISPLGLYWYMYNNQNQIKSRIVEKNWKKIKVFFEYFPVIKEYIENLKK